MFFHRGFIRRDDYLDSQKSPDMVQHSLVHQKALIERTMRFDCVEESSSLVAKPGDQALYAY